MNSPALVAAEREHEAALLSRTNRAVGILTDVHRHGEDGLSHVLCLDFAYLIILVHGVLLVMLGIRVHE